MADRKTCLLIAGRAYPPHIGGIEKVMAQQAEYFAARMPTEVLVCREGTGLAQTERRGGVQVTRSGCIGTLRGCPLSLSYAVLFRRRAAHADTVILHMPYPPADLALLLSGFQGRVIALWHSGVVRQRMLLRLYRPLMHALLRRADVIVTASRAMIGCSPDLTPYRGKCTVIPYGIDPSDAADRPHAHPLTQRLCGRAVRRILFAGRLVYYKGADILLDAFAKIRSPAELFLAGGGRLGKKLRRQAEALRIVDRVHFLGVCKTPELRDMLADCDLFVLPSSAESESFGIVQLEAMLCGKPVINTALPTGVPEVSLHLQTGLTVPPGDADALAAAMDRLLSDHALRERYGRAARERVLREFSLPDVLRHWEQLVTGRDTVADSA